MPSKTSSSWPPTALQKTSAQPLSLARVGEHLLSLRVLADVKGRRGEVDEEVGACGRALDRGRAGLPQVLAHREADRRLAALQEGDLRSGLEVPLLVEDAVVREQALAVDGA